MPISLHVQYLYFHLKLQSGSLKLTQKLYEL